MPKKRPDDTVLPRRSHAFSLDTLAMTYHLTGDHARAIATVEQALALLPGSASERRELEGHLAQLKAALQQQLYSLRGTVYGLSARLCR